MKNSTFNSKLIYSACIAGSLLFTTSISESVASNVYGTSFNSLFNELVIVSMNNEDDEKFVTEVAEMNIREIALGQLAQEKGNSTHVKNLGRTMQEDHMRSMAELSELATARNISLNSPSSTPSQPDEDYQNLENLEGDEFGMAYSQLMVKKQKEAIDKFEKISESSEDAEIKAFASERLTVLKSHLEEAEKCVEKCEESKDSSKVKDENKDELKDKKKDTSK
ncbi:DUF4142 domain-containing protein [Lunatibacter salilacus]|uniref:DUF4142 domain-containing protein n=1 Tax=Lunatibacter salilacus TaxID=2483804 RepID=UPI00131AE0DE|nr:DUF4142 domain-containing protein [Lunatibacter salilacus]